MELREYRAAGGIVLDDAGRVLMIERLILREGQIGLEVRLPKGHVEPGETDEQAALREVCEETGYCGLAVNADLGEYLNEFNWPDQQARVLRHEHYYLMRLTDPVRSEPQFDSPDADEARFTPRWAANLAEVEQMLTFGSEKEFARRAQGSVGDRPECDESETGTVRDWPERDESETGTVGDWPERDESETGTVRDRPEL